MKKSQLSASDIQKEQLFLVQLEHELTNVLGKINENLNTLKVEELQLRTNAVSNIIPHDVEEPSKVEVPILKSESQPIFNDNPEMVNQQKLDLDVYLSHLNDEEDDD